MSRPIFPKPAAMAKKNELKGRTSFDSQLYIFEAVGVLISMEGVNPLKQVEYLTVSILQLNTRIRE